MLPTENHEANRRTASESRMREIRPSGSMRGRRVLGSTKRASLLYLMPAIRSAFNPSNAVNNSRRPVEEVDQTPQQGHQQPKRQHQK